MAKKLYCDCCHHIIDETDEEKKNWSHLTFSSVGTSAAFNNYDLCPACTGSVRLLLQKGDRVEEGVT